MPKDQLEYAYRLIAWNRYNEAINALNKVLKKQPEFKIAKVWKCEALHGLGNVVESEEIMAGIMAEEPTDRRTIDCIAEFYRARGNYTKLVEVYENAVKHEPSDENLRMSLFECSGLAGDYKKQQQQALLLYKSSSKMLFYCMAVVCLMQQAEESPVALELAERMMIKQHEAGKLTTRNELYLFVTLLERRGKFDEALKYLEKYATDLDFLISSSDKKIDLLIKLERWADVIIETKNNLKTKPDNWLYYEKYILAVSKLEALNSCSPSASYSVPVETTLAAATDYLKVLKIDHSSLRGPSLALIEATKITAQAERDSELCNLLADYIDKFGEKQVSVFDVSKYSDSIGEVHRKELSAKLNERYGINQNLLQEQSKLGIPKHISLLQTRKLLGSYAGLNLDDREQLCKDLENCYLTSQGGERREHYLILLSYERFTLFKETGNAEHLIQAAVAIENSLTELTVVSLQFILLQIYFALGASKTARKIYEQLRIQSLQVDSLVHILLSRISCSGHLTIASEMWETGLRILQQCNAESLEALVWCYRAGLFHRVEEFTQCAKRFQQTITVPLLRGEKTFLDLVLAEPNRAEQTLVKCRSPNNWDVCLDNRDLSTIPTWNPSTNQPSKSDSYAELLYYCKIRESTLICLSNAMAFVKNREENEEKGFCTALDNLQAIYDNANSRSWTERDLTQMPTTRLYRLLKTPLPSLIGKFVEADLASADKTCSILQQSICDCLKVVTEQKQTNPRLSAEAVVTHIELLAVLTALCVAGRPGLLPHNRRRSDQLVRALETNWTTLEEALPAMIVPQSPVTNPNRTVVENKLRENYQIATDDLRKVIRRKASSLNKLLKC